MCVLFHLSLLGVRTQDIFSLVCCIDANIVNQDGVLCIYPQQVLNGRSNKMVMSPTQSGLLTNDSDKYSVSIESCSCVILCVNIRKV